MGKRPVFRPLFRDIDANGETIWSRTTRPPWNGFSARDRVLRSRRSPQTTLCGIEAIRTIKRGHVHRKPTAAKGLIEFIRSLIGNAPDW